MGAVSQMGHALAGASVGWLALGVLLHLANQAVRGRGWFAIVRAANPGDESLRRRDAIQGAWWETTIPHDAKAIVRRSADRYIRALAGEMP